MAGLDTAALCFTAGPRGVLLLLDDVVDFGDCCIVGLDVSGTLDRRVVAEPSEVSGRADSQRESNTCISTASHYTRRCDDRRND